MDVPASHGKMSGRSPNLGPENLLPGCPRFPGSCQARSKHLAAAGGPLWFSTWEILNSKEVSLGGKIIERFMVDFPSNFQISWPGKQGKVTLGRWASHILIPLNTQWVVSPAMVARMPWSVSMGEYKKGCVPKMMGAQMYSDLKEVS